MNAVIIATATTVSHAWRHLSNMGWTSQHSTRN